MNKPLLRTTMGGRIYKIYLHNKNALDEVVIKKNDKFCINKSRSFGIHLTKNFVSK